MQLELLYGKRYAACRSIKSSELTLCKPNRSNLIRSFKFGWYILMNHKWFFLLLLLKLIASLYEIYQHFCRFKRTLYSCIWFQDFFWKNKIWFLNWIIIQKNIKKKPQKLWQAPCPSHKLEWQIAYKINNFVKNF